MNRLAIAFLAAQLATTATFAADTATTTTIPVDSSAFVFSPGNWTGDDGRSGKLFRQTWNPNAYFRVSWETKNSKPSAKLLLDTSSFTAKFGPPHLAYSVDGVWTGKVPCAKEIVLENLAGAGKHTLTVVLYTSTQVERWGSPGKSGLNVLRVTGLQTDADATPVPDAPAPKWALIVGDSITEGCGAGPLAPYSHLLGEALRTQGYEYGVSACGWSGWLNRGDNPPDKDVPAYYVVSKSTDGVNGEHDDQASRWNKIDGNNHSLLDSKGHLSAYGQENQEPALIVINYGTNDALWRSNPLDTSASMVQALAALRKSAPEARIVMLVPFGQYFVKEIKAAVATHQQNHPGDTKVSVIDLGRGVAKTLAAPKNLLGGLHPNDLGHANFAAQIIPQVMSLLAADAKR